MTNYTDPLEAANEVQPQSMHYFGQILLTAWYCALVKGQGKVVYDPAQHDKRFTAIDLTLAPFAGSKATYTIERQYVAEFKEWAGTVLPSIHAFNLTPMSINQKWVHVEMVKTGTYSKNGETKDLTSPRVLAVFDSEADCERAALAHFGKSEEQAFDHTAPAAQGDLHPASNGATPGNNAIEAFVNALYAQAQGDVEKLNGLIAGIGMDPNSKEVQAAIAKKTAVVPF